MSSERGIFRYALIYVLVASLQYQFAKDGLRYADPFLLMCIRYFIASALCFAIARNFRPILNRDTLLLSVFTFISTAFWAVGLTTVSAGQSAVLSYTMPLFAIPLSALILKEGTSRLGMVGALIGFAGVATYGFALTEVGGSTVGVVLTLTNSFFWGLYTVYFRKLRNQDPFRTVATQLFIGGLLFLPFLPFNLYLNPTSEFFIDAAYVSGVGGAVAFLLWNAMTRADSIARVTTLAFAVPATAVVIQALLTGEIPTPVEIVGVAVMFTGIYISRARPRKRPEAPRGRGPAVPVGAT